MNNCKIIQDNSNYSIHVPVEQAGLRIDLFLTTQLPDLSRSFIKKLLNNKQVVINNTTPAKPSYIIKYNDIITLPSVTTPTERVSQEITDDLGIIIIAQHPDFLIINKPVGLIVHPPDETYTELALTDWLVQKFPTITTVGDTKRPGIVHRLDRNTSGIMIVALTSQAHQTFTDMFKNRTIQKTYIAIVHGHPQQSGTIDYEIGRHPVQKNIMHCFTGMSENPAARDSLTHYKVLEYFDTTSLVEVKPKTGRTHQIRVHFKAIGHPLLGDAVYGGASKRIAYHALHARDLEFTYNNVAYQFSSPLDEKLQQLIDTSIPAATIE